MTKQTTTTPVFDTDSKLKTTDLGGSGATGSNVLFGDKTWKSPSAGATNIKQVEVDFGNVNYTDEGVFTISDTDVTTSSQILAFLSREAPTNKDQDETEMDDIIVYATPLTGQLELRVKSLSGSIYGAFKINYLVG